MLKHHQQVKIVIENIARFLANGTLVAIIITRKRIHFVTILSPAVSDCRMQNAAAKENFFHQAKIRKQLSKMQASAQGQGEQSGHQEIARVQGVASPGCTSTRHA
jgi:hypothetical protein